MGTLRTKNHVNWRERGENKGEGENFSHSYSLLVHRQNKMVEKKNLGVGASKKQAN